MKLENLALEMPKLKGEVKVYQLVDLAYMSPAGLYGSGDVKITGNKIVIPLSNLGIKDLNDLHDTYNMDRYGNLYGGHTTFNNDYHINVDPLKARDNKILGKK